MRCVSRFAGLCKPHLRRCDDDTQIEQDPQTPPFEHAPNSLRQGKWGRFADSMRHGARCAILARQSWSLGQCELTGAVRMAQGSAVRRGFKGGVGAVSWRAAWCAGFERRDAVARSA